MLNKCFIILNNFLKMPGKHLNILLHFGMHKKQLIQVAKICRRVAYFLLMVEKNGEKAYILEAILKFKMATEGVV